mmetsp:Transcript_20327/g.32300  ORF Transcript_20327/g.32300 Transcript_20327/m.32300 type:complete len:402 (+) Transcript_20327:99-1304(+)
MAFIFAIPAIILTLLMFAIALSFGIYSVRHKYWFEKDAPRRVRLALTICVACYLLSGFFGFLFYLFAAIFAFNDADQRAHPVAGSMFWLLLFLYVFAIFLNLYVWIQRLQFIYIKSAYKVNTCLIRTLKTLFAMIIFVAFVVILLYLVAGQDDAGQAIQASVDVLTIAFILLFIGEALAVPIAFVRKLRDMMRALRKCMAANAEETTLAFIGNLLTLQRKMTILVCVQVSSTVIAVFLTVPLDHNIAALGFSIDAFVGFLCVYCTLATHDMMFQKLCRPCISCCALCGKVPIGKAGKPRQDDQTVASGSTMQVSVDKGGSGGSEETETKATARTHAVMPSTTNPDRMASYSVDQTDAKLQSQTRGSMAPLSMQRMGSSSMDPDDAGSATKAPSQTENTEEI